MAKPSRRAPAPKFQAQRPVGVSRRRATAPSEQRPMRSFAGPLVIVVVIAALAFVALPALGPAASGTPTPAASAVAVADMTLSPGIADDSLEPTIAPVAGTSAAGVTPPQGPTPLAPRWPSAYPVPIEAASRRLDRAMTQMASDVGAPGLVAAVKLPDGSVWYGAEGALWPDGPQATPDTPFAWGSITKSFVAALTLRLVAEGRLDLDQTIDAWVPEIADSDRITLRMLLRHRSGLFDYFQHPDYKSLVFDRLDHPWTTEEILSLTGPRVFRPDAGFGYSNTNYVVAGLILERVTGTPLATLIRDRLLVPLGLDQTVFQQAGMPVGLEGARGFWKSGRGFRDWSDDTDFRPNTSAATVAWAAGAMQGSVRDLLDWEMALYGGEVLPPDQLAQMLDFSRNSGYGMGARTQTLLDRPGYGHGGSLRGFVSVMYRLPAEGIDVVVLANLGFANLDRVASRLVRASINAFATPEPAVAAPTSLAVPQGSPPG